MSKCDQIRPSVICLAAVRPMHLCRELLEFNTNTATEAEGTIPEPRVFQELVRK